MVYLDSRGGGGRGILGQRVAVDVDVINLDRGVAVDWYTWTEGWRWMWYTWTEGWTVDVVYLDRGWRWTWYTWTEGCGDVYTWTEGCAMDVVYLGQRGGGWDV
ncbi:unnamed protein product [Staurois parvus]|uniref:Uncharacterized protein n=1 Tax=Staurois parvus TaxID=386267 RepID=A0ABN9H3B7_9NEOB|nr:unnamed protein product [Staurois parvus]